VSSGYTKTDVRRAERTTHLTIVTVVVLVLLPLLLWPGVASLIWWLQSDVPLDLVVYDQTVPDRTFLEHASLGLALEYHKIPFSTEASFIGSGPGGLPQGNWPEDRPDLVMLVDAYGVYLDDGGEISDQGTSRVTEALSVDDAALVVGWADHETLVYGEFNILGEPTTSAASLMLQDLFEVRRTGWAGRPFDDLALVPDRLIELAGGSWDYSGPGIVLISPSIEGAVVVVLSSDDLEEAVPIVEGVLPGSERSTRARLVGWFEVVEAAPESDVLMQSRLELTQSGHRLLEEHGIPTEWPFLVQTDKSLYLAADASENNIEFPLRRMSGAATLMRTVPNSVDTEFFYRVYLPIVSWLVETSYPGDDRG
jgi:hypothetical protein